jgi:SAM-dependent methyltransferase
VRIAVRRFRRIVGGVRWFRRIVTAILKNRFNFGFCIICNRSTLFLEVGPWLRDQYVCIGCRSIPRSRAIIHALTAGFPNWRHLQIHESSPGSPSSDLLRCEGLHYSSSQFFPGVLTGTCHHGERCEDLQNLSFPDESFDLFVTQDVFEHIPAPQKGYREVARVLKPGGAHVFTIPLYKGKPTLVRARLMEDGTLVKYLADDYHANPVDPKGSLVTTEWGDDVADFIYEASGLKTEVLHYRDRRLGLDGEFLYVFISRKPPA